MARRPPLRLAAFLVALAAPAWGEPIEPAPLEPTEEARQQYEAGTQAFQAKRYVEAALHFEAAAARKPHAVTLYTAALAWEQANYPERAADDFERALDVPGPGLSAAQTQNAHERLVSLEKTMGTAEVIAPEGWRVQIDANSRVTTPAHLHALPGLHTLAGEGPAGVVERRDLSLDPGKVVRVELTAPLPAPVPAASSDARPSIVLVAAPPQRGEGRPFDVRRLAGAAIAGIGVGALASGTVLGESALSARDAYNAAPSRAGYDHARALATWTDVALVAGGVLLAGGVVLAIVPSRSVDPSGARRVSLGVLPSDRGALLVGEF